MPPILRNTPKSYRSCILYEFQLGKSIKEAYKNVCKNTKNDKFGNMEFEYWFNRFANGNIDLDDESFAKKSPSFSDLPFEIVGVIVEELDLKDRLNTRKVSRFLQSVVDGKNTEYGPKSILIDDSSITIEFDDNLVIYNKKDDNCLMKYGSSETRRSIFQSLEKKKVLNGNYLDIAFNDLKIAMKNPAFQLEFLKFRVEGKAELQAKKVVEFLESLESPFQVKSFVFYWHYGLEYALPILSKLKPGTLENINFGHMMPGLNMYFLTKMEQWKQAKEFRFANPIKIGIKKLLHFNRCYIHVESSISAQNILDLRNAFQNSSNFEYFHLEWSIDSSMIAKIGKALHVRVFRRTSTSRHITRHGPVTTSWKQSTISHRHPIPGSNEFLEFIIDEDSLSIERNQ